MITLTVSVSKDDHLFIADFHIAGIWQVVTERLKRVVMYSIAEIASSGRCWDCRGQRPSYFYSSWLLSLLGPRWIFLPSPMVPLGFPRHYSGLSWRSIELLVELGGQLLGRCEQDFIEGNCFVLCLAFCSAMNSVNSSPQLGQVCLLVHGFNKVPQFFPFVHTYTVLYVFIQSWQFRWGGVSFTEVISFVHHVQYLCWYRFIMESVTSSRDVVWCCFE